METLSINFQAATRDGGFGLKHFISEIRNSKSKDEERVRVDKELANIRQKFANTANLTSYQKKKYVSKLCYIYMLGYDVDFGHMEFISLLSSTKFSEKSVGYLAFSLMLRPGDELMTLVLNSMRNDIVGQINFGQTLALATVANMGGVHLAETLSADVQRLVIRYVEMGGNYSSMTGPGGIPAESIARNHAFVVKKACLCMLHLFRFNPDSVIPDEWKKNLARLLEDRDLGVVTSTMSLMQALVAHSPSAFEDLVPYVISILNRLVVNRSCIPDYYYYQIPSPWLQVKCLRVLQNYKLPEGTQQDLLFEILTRILVKSDVAESGNRSNADNSVLLEAVNLVISYGADANSTLKSQIGAILGRFLTYKDANIRYLGLDAMTRLAKADGAEAVHMHQRTVLDSMKDIDISVKKRALNLLYVMTDKSNAKDIVGELVAILEESESAIKEDMVVKIAILAEKFSSGDLEWYINTLVQVIVVAGDFVAEAVWFRVVQVVTNSPETVHEYAAEKLLQTVQNKWLHETAVALAAYLLGEIGLNICEKPGMSGYDQFNALHQHFLNCSVKVQAILLTTYVKLLNLYPEQTSDLVADVFNKYSTSSDLELQQRACEYLAMPKISEQTRETVLNAMPVYELSEKDNILLALGETATNAVSNEAPRESTSKPQVSSLPVPPVKAAVTDLLSMGEEEDVSISGGFTASNNFAASSSPSRITELGVGSDEINRLLLRAALCRTAASHCTLLNNKFIDVSFSAEYRAHQGRLALFFKNQSSSIITGLKVTVDSVKDDYITFKQIDPPASIDPSVEVKAQYAVECLRPIPIDDVWPNLSIDFVVGGIQYAYALCMPVSIVSFCEPLPSDKATYMGRWKAIEGEGTEAQQVFSSSTAIDANLMKHVKTVIFPGMGVGAAEGLDNERTATGSASFRTGTVGADGKTVAIGVLMRLEGDPTQNKFRITVRSKHPSVAQGIKKFIVEQLS